MKATLLRTAFALTLATLATAPFAQTVSWSKNVWSPSGAATYLGDGKLISRTMATDGSGHVIITGSASGGAAGSVWVTTKLNGATGALLWQKTFAGSGGNDNALAVAVDGSGNAYVVGSTMVTATNSDVKIIKYSAADGAVMWEKTFDAGNSDYGYVVAVDGSGNAIVGAESMNTSNNNDVKILKFAAANGALAWQQTIDGGRDDFISDLALDSSGNVLGAGVSVNANGNTDVRAFKLGAADGAPAWNKVIDSGGADEAFDVAVDSAGNSLVAGYVTVGGVQTVALFKFAAADGATTWQKAIAPGTAQGVAADGAGNVIVIAQVVNASGNHDFRTIKYTSAGAAVWDKTFDSGGEDYAYQLALDAAGNAIVAGSTAMGGNYDWRAVDYSSADGSVLWQSRYNGTANGADQNYGLALAGNGVFVGGTSSEQGRAMGVRVAKLVPGSGVAPNGRKSNADFDGDKRADVIWQAADGSVRIWLMNGTSVIDSAVVLGGGTGWKVIGTGDLDGDGRADIVWQNANTGAVAIWMMNGLGAASYRQIYDGGSDWQVTHVADLDGDGKADLVWKNKAGAIAVWLMDGYTAKTYRQILDPGMGWSVIAAGDLNGDGKADLVMQYTDGTVFAWIMNGTNAIDSGKLLDANTGWSAVNAGDLDGDGKADIVWTHASGASAVWLMNGKTAKSYSQLAAAGNGWTPRKALDFDGDGKADLLWDHTDGSVAVWLMNGAAMQSAFALVSTGNTWSIAATGK